VRRAALIVVVAAALAAVGSSPALAASARLTPAGDATFPKRAYVLTLPAGAATGAGTVQVLENGQPVSDLRVRSASDRFAVMLVIDSSTSMRGTPIRGAMAAARAFVRQRPDQQALGVVTFNDAPQVLVGPTRDTQAIERALAPQPQLRRGTHIYDALGAAVKQIAGPKFDAAAIVLLSDGHDYGSTTSFDRLVAASRRAHAKLFTVGLRSSYYDPSTLVDIARRGLGEYVGAATPAKLTALYERLGSELSAAYSLRYLSSAASATHVRVTATLGAERASIGYTAPRLHVPGTVGATHPPADHAAPFLGTKRGAALVGFVVFVLAFLALGTYLQQRKRMAMHERLADYGATSVAPSIALEAAPRKTEGDRSGWLIALASDLELGRLDISPRRYLLECAGLAAAFAILATAVAGNGAVGILAFLLAWPIATWGRRRRAIAKQRSLFAEQLADSVETIASAMRTGHSFGGAIAQTVETAPEPTASEFRRVIADERLGVSLEIALERIVERMRNKHLKQVSLVTVIQRETGGNGAEALDRVVENIRAGDDLRRLIRTLTSQGRIAQLVLTALPVATAVAFRFLGGEAMDPLFNTGAGHIALVCAALLVTLGGISIGRIVKVKV
jgi:tight adherence protein B